MYLVANRVTDETDAAKRPQAEQLDLFTDYDALQKKREADAAEDERERRLQSTVIKIKDKYGKNAILKGMNLVDGATAADRNGRIGGHKA